MIIYWHTCNPQLISCLRRNLPNEWVVGVARILKNYMQKKLHDLHLVICTSLRFDRGLCFT